MIHKYLMIVACFLMTACAEIVYESQSSETIKGGLEDGENYQVRTRLLDDGDGEYQQTSAVYLGRARECSPDHPTDCADKARELIKERRKFTN